MFTHNAPNRRGERGFTLIELSIVLVIIGLLIGGILQGQEMINQTRLKTTVAQTDGLTAAVRTFEDKFNALPGDDGDVANILGVNCGGECDGDGLITNGGGSPNINGGSDEAPLAIAMLDAAGFLQGIEGADATANMPARMDGVWLDVSSADMPDGTTVDALVVRFRANEAGGGWGGALEPALTSDDAFAIDQRYDDGNPNDGRFQAMNDNGQTCVDANDNTKYAAATDTPSCTAAMQIN